MVKEKYKLVSFFHGVGGMSKGAEQSGFETLYATDCWDVAENAFHANKKVNKGCFDNYNFHDMTAKRILQKINDHYTLRQPLDIGDVDCVVSGSPCPGQSSVNPFRSNFDIRNSLMVKQIRLAGMQGLYAKTAWFEQVPGFLDTPMKALRMEVLATLMSQKDYTFSIRVLNAVDYGSYQSRDRVTICMIRKDVGRPGFPDAIPIDLSKQSVAAVLPNIIAFKYGKSGTPKLASASVINTMTASGDALFVMDAKGWRPVSIDERQKLSHLDDYDLSMFNETDRIRLMGNLVQIPFAKAMMSYIQNNIF